MAPRRVPRDVLRIIFTFVDDPLAWHQLSQINRAARQISKQLLVTLTRPRRERIIFGGHYGFHHDFAGAEQYQALPCGIPYGQGVLTCESYISVTKYFCGQPVKTTIWFSWNPRYGSEHTISLLLVRIDHRKRWVQRWQWEEVGRDGGLTRLSAYITPSWGPHKYNLSSEYKYSNREIDSWERIDYCNGVSEKPILVAS